MPNVYVPQVDIWGAYNRSLEGIGQGVGNIAGTYYGSKYTLNRKKKMEEEEYQKQRKREEEEYRIAQKRKEELEQGTIGRAYKGLLGLKRPEIYDESGEQIASPAPMRGVPTDLPADVYTKMMEAELVKQGLLPGVKNEFSLADGYRLNKDTGTVTKIPDWKPKADYKEREKPIKGGLFIKEYSNDGGQTWNAVPDSVPYSKKEGEKPNAWRDDYFATLKSIVQKDDFGNIIDPLYMKTLKLGDKYKHLTPHDAAVSAYEEAGKQADREAALDAGRTYYKDTKDKESAVRQFKEAGWSDKDIRDVTGRATMKEIPTQEGRKVQERKVINGKSYIKIDGRWYEK